MKKNKKKQLYNLIGSRKTKIPKMTIKQYQMS